MMRLNMAVSREVRAELERQELKPKAITFWLNCSDSKARTLCAGNAVWTMPDLEVVCDGLGVTVSEMLSRCAARLQAP
ncbi:hypothetical protein BCR15_01945 [Tessaracoccus lapidicaptus]|uniref:Uncharacterized protein n=1 Tax=Tessaracoccus lapidicaptus TaxID=1427523 RepID=A0A1C0AMC0_9ACTN|nr:MULTISPECIES: hypothetical protein [Tessaracoccus]AQX14850.1 hypothetical protein BKM78_02070 [Tessaracoccus sp. T2.5-30]OCL34491.1 hypothetical protein BCR15_01945 [Tessaracoccus lapidicaptus]VEP38971.1 hypothetical protein TLA_TLA_00422 [Tessaracoccus lapidicaptus]